MLSLGLMKHYKELATSTLSPPPTKKKKRKKKQCSPERHRSKFPPNNQVLYTFHLTTDLTLHVRLDNQQPL